MRKTRFIILFLSLFLATGFISLTVKPVSARYAPPKTLPPPKPTFITVINPGSQELGKEFIVTGVLTESGVPLDSRPVVITVNGKFIGQARTDKNGKYSSKITQNLSSGNYQLSATFKGTRKLALSTASVPLRITPAQIHIQATPPIAGVPFTIAGQTFFTDDKGMVVVTVDKAGIYRLTVEADKYTNPVQRIEFARWLDESYLTYRDIQVPMKGTIPVGLNLYYRVNQTFVDLQGKPVDPKRITGITIKSAQGDIFTYQQGQTLWVPASRIARRQTGLQQTNLLYSVMNVTVDGSNVVIAAQQRFFTGTNETWKITLTLYTMQVYAKDILFGSPVGKTVLLKYPNGRIESFPLNQEGFVSIPSLARGIYQVQLTGTKGLDNTSPVALSRNQVVTENVVSYTDLAVTASFSLFIALGLLLFGRPWLLVSRRRRIRFKRYALRESSRVSIHDN